MNKLLDEKIKQAPRAPGVYLFKNKEKKIIYIGKAADLKKRLVLTSIKKTTAAE